jgi:hypothetical protein
VKVLTSCTCLADVINSYTSQIRSTGNTRYMPRNDAYLRWMLTGPVTRADDWLGGNSGCLVCGTRLRVAKHQAVCVAFYRPNGICNTTPDAHAFAQEASIVDLTFAALTHTCAASKCVLPNCAIYRLTVASCVAVHNVQHALVLPSSDS